MKDSKKNPQKIEDSKTKIKKIKKQKDSLNKEKNHFLLNLPQPFKLIKINNSKNFVCPRQRRQFD